MQSGFPRRKHFEYHRMYSWQTSVFSVRGCGLWAGKGLSRAPWVTIKLASTALRIWSNYFPWTVFFPGYVVLSCTIASEKKKKLSILSKIYETFFFFFFSLIVFFSKVGRAEQPEVFKVWGHFGCASDMMVLCLIHFSLLIVPGHCRTL